MLPLAYSPRLAAIINSFGLKPLARNVYYRLHRPKDGAIAFSVGQHTARFRVKDAVELRTVEHGFFCEEEGIAEILKAIRPNDTFLDVGANLGIYSMFAAAAGAKVVACEPEPIARERLVANAKLNTSDLTVIPKAISDRCGTATFSAADPAAVSQSARLSAVGVQVELATGDSLGIHPNVIKIDVEGHEGSVLRGLRGSLASCRLCMVEIHDYPPFNVVPAEIYALLREAGFSDIRELPGKKHAARR